ncbi:hypothetical protein [Aureimonas jatrophae]|uniref:Protein phosphatase 2C n=1 Tax=Aureimonas jatrophae TaxID=1166073 RepID=A0A1H0LRQ6_9HYPH|nr:hypothetical protein [Aureimonas jatrophae]MBB3952714.1 hypothetical protein [Aureimonas jatrophae]SDO70888.1 hypothetical protein SAMN05192530_11122 [Aureimonas jatrophae]
MHLEAFSRGKRLDHPETNEDSFVVVEGAGYAVIDGVTDRNGTRYDGMLSGRFASRRVKAATERFLVAQRDRNAAPELRYTGPDSFARYLTASLRAGYVETGSLDRATADWSVRASCTIMAVIQFDDRFEMVAVGDSGLRVNGRELVQSLKPLDDVTGILRREAWALLAERGYGRERCAELSSFLTWNGTRPPSPGPLGDEIALVGEIEARALDACRAHLPDAPQWELEDLVRRGIAHGQGDFVNTTERALGYGCLDGFEIPSAFIDHRVWPVEEVETLELFSDGYFKPGEGFGIAAWEAAFREVETADPDKLGRFLSTKGTTAGIMTDDRTYLGVRFA